MQAILSVDPDDGTIGDGYQRRTWKEISVQYKRIACSGHFEVHDRYDWVDLVVREVLTLGPKFDGSWYESRWRVLNDLLKHLVWKSVEQGDRNGCLESIQYGFC